MTLVACLCDVLGAAPAPSGTCPPETFVRTSAAGAHQHCICPASHICEGCAQGCHTDSSPFKQRCVNGFKPDCTDCRCQAASEQAKSEYRRYGQIIDRRREPFCPLEIQQEQQYTGDHRFVFVVSNGHTGTTFFGKQSVWRENFVKGSLIKGVHIAHEQDADAEKLKKIGFSDR